MSKDMNNKRRSLLAVVASFVILGSGFYPGLARAQGSDKLTLRQAVFETTEGRDSHVTGWTSCLGRFADYMLTVA